jgi:hypothetical protein
LETFRLAAVEEAGLTGEVQRFSRPLAALAASDSVYTLAAVRALLALDERDLVARNWLVRVGQQPLPEGEAGDQSLSAAGQCGNMAWLVLSKWRPRYSPANVERFRCWLTAATRSAGPEQWQELVALTRENALQRHGETLFQAVATGIGVDEADRTAGLDLPRNQPLTETIAARLALLGSVMTVPAAAAEALTAAAAQKRGVAQAAADLGEAGLVELGVDLAEWQAAWADNKLTERYQRDTVAALALCTSLAGRESRLPSILAQEQSLAVDAMLTLLHRVAVEQQLAAAAEPLPMLLAEMAKPWSPLTDLAKRVAALGAGVLPQVLAQIEAAGADRVPSNEVAVLLRWARRTPAALTPLLPRLQAVARQPAGQRLAGMFERLFQWLGGESLTALRAALAAEAPLASATLDPDVSFRPGKEHVAMVATALTRALAENKGAVPLLYDYARELGSAELLAPLAECWAKDQSVALADAAVTICLIHGTEHALLPEWQRVRAEAEKRTVRRPAAPAHTQPVWVQQYKAAAAKAAAAAKEEAAKEAPAKKKAKRR